MLQILFDASDLEMGRRHPVQLLGVPSPREQTSISSSL